MPTIEDVARGALALIDSDTDFLTAGKFVAERYKELAGRARFRHLRRIGQVALPGVLASGVVSVTPEHEVVTGDATAQAAWASHSPVGWSLRVGRSMTWYEVVGLVDGELRLSVPWAEAALVEQPYRLVKRYHTLAPKVRHIGDLIFMPRHWRLDYKSLDELNSLAPSRTRLGAAPWVWTEVGTALDDEGQSCRLVEIYPYVQQPAVVHYTYWEEAPTLDLTDALPPNMDEYVLREGVLVDLMRREMSRAQGRGNVEAAALWRNDYRAQETRWDRKVQEAIRNDRGSDDLTAILKRPQYSFGDLDITDARGHVYAGWPR